MRKSSSKQAAYTCAKRGPAVIHARLLTHLPSGFHFEDSCVGGAFGLTLARLAYPHSLRTCPAPCAVQLTLVTRVGPDSTQKERCTQLTPVHLPEGSSFPSDRLCPCSLCPPSPPVVPILPELGLSVTSSGTSPLTTFTNMILITNGFLKHPRLQSLINTV